MSNSIADPSDEDKLRHFDYMQKFAAQLKNLDDVDELIWYVCEQLIPNLDFDDCVIYLSDVSKQVLVQKAAWGNKTSAPREVFQPISLNFGEGICGAVAENGEVITVNDTRKDKRYKLDIDTGLSECAVPLFYDGKVIGVLDSENPKADYFSSYHEQLLTTVAALISNRIGESLAKQEVKITIDTLQRAEKQQKALFEIASLVHQSKDMQDFYERLHRIISKLVYSGNFFIAIYDKKTEIFNIPYYVDTLNELLNVNESAVVLKRTLTFHCLQQSKTLLLTQAMIEEMDRTYNFEQYGDMPNSWLGVPFALDDNSTGIIVVQSYSEDIAYTKEDSELFEFVAQNLAATLKFKKSLHEFKSLKEVLPICSYCKKIRDDKNSWEQMESYISSHADTKFSHGICPDCYPKVRDEWGLDVK